MPRSFFSYEEQRRFILIVVLLHPSADAGVHGACVQQLLHISADHPCIESFRYKERIFSFEPVPDADLADHDVRQRVHDKAGLAMALTVS